METEMFKCNFCIKLKDSVKLRTPAKFRSLLLLTAMHSMTLGCDSPGTAPTVPVEGRLLHNGKPATAARVVFMPASGRPASGNTDEQGYFVLSTFAPEDGAVTGAHKVTVSDLERNWNQDPSKSRFPTPYERPDTTPLIVEVKAANENEFTFDMKN
jgi:hypothetical protein